MELIVDNSYQYNQNVYHTYDESPSIYTVSLFVSDDNNCKDTTYRNILIKDEHWIYIPNSFSPDGIKIRLMTNFIFLLMV